MLLEYIHMAFGCTVDYTEDWHSRRIALYRPNKGYICQALGTADCADL